MAANTKKTYFLSPSFDWPAENGPVKLGAIIAKRDKPHRRIGSDEFTIPKDQYKAEKIGWQDERWKQRNWYATLWTKFLEGVGFKVGANGDWSKADIIKCDKLMTQEFVPSDSYVKERMGDPVLQSYLKKNRIRVYMITGIKVAYNPVACHFDGRVVGGEARLDVGLAAASVPGSLGGGVGGNSNSGTVVGQKGGADIVYAYQLMRIEYEVNEGVANVETKEETRGAFLHAGSKSKVETERVESMDGIFVEFSELVDAETTGDDVEVSSGCVDEIDGTECIGVRMPPEFKLLF